MSGVVLMSNINNSSLYIGYSEESVMCVCIMYRSIDQGLLQMFCRASEGIAHSLSQLRSGVSNRGREGKGRLEE